MKYIESDKIELKETLTDDIKKEIVAFLNTHGGTIYIGVKDNGTIVSNFTHKDIDEFDKKIANWVQEAFFPSVNTLISLGLNDDNVFYIDMKEGKNKPYYLRDKGPKPSGVYKRVGSTTRKANDSEILLMLLDAKDYSFEADVSDEQNLTFKYFLSYCDENNISLDRRSMTSLKILNKDGKYTNLALLLSDQSPIVIKFAKYDKDLNFIVKKEHKGSLIKVLNDVLEHALNFNTISAVIDQKSFKRIEQISYPGKSLREIILNAVAHANYFIRSNIKIEFYDNEVKITSPGGIYDATYEDIMKGVQTYRNPGLVNILNKLHFIENFGTGIPRTLKAYEKYDNKPKFAVTESFFTVTLPNVNYYQPLESDNSNKETIKLDLTLTDLDLLILKTIGENPGLSAVKIHRIIVKDNKKYSLDMVKNSFKRHLNNYCEFRGAKTNGGYYLKK